MNDRQWSSKKSRSIIYVIYFLWSSMISYKASITQICFFFRLYDRQWSLTMPQSPKFVSYLSSMIVNDLLKSLGRSYMCFIYFLWSSMISCNASIAQICFFLRLFYRQWSLTKPRLPKYVSYLDSMIVNDLSHSLSRPNSYVPYLDSMIINDLLHSLVRSNICLI